MSEFLRIQLRNSGETQRKSFTMIGMQVREQIFHAYIRRDEKFFSQSSSAATST